MTAKIIVQKYGGTSVASPERIKAVAARIKSYVDQGFKLAVVVSAMGKSTDKLVDLAGEITDQPSNREMDMLLSTGEQVTISLLTMALHHLGIKAVSFTGFQIKVLTDGHYSRGKIKSISRKKLEEALVENQVVVVAGFQGIDQNDEIITLGRGGSDTSAVALAVALEVRDCEIYTDVDGVYTADPNIISRPKKLKEISYAEMLELARLGAGVLHSRSVELAKKNRIKLHIRSSFNFEEGTIVMPKEEMMESFMVSGVTSKEDEAKVTLREIPDRPGVAAALFFLLGEHKIYVNMIIQSTGKEDKASISFTVLKKDLKKTIQLCGELKGKFGDFFLDYKEDIAIISAIGVGMLSSYGVAGQMFQVLSAKGINIEMIATSEVGISCVIDSKDLKEALQLVHQEFLEV